MSEPKVLLIHWNKGKWRAKDRPVQALTENACETWVFAFDGDYLNTSLAKPLDLQGYDIIIANSDPIHLEKLCALSASRPASSKWVTLLEGDALDYIKPRPYIRELLDSSDLINCINKYSESFFKQFTSAPVRYIGFPYPAENIRALSTPIEMRKKEIFLAPMLLARWLEYFCVKDLGIPYFGYEKRLSRKLRTIAQTLTRYRTLDPLYFHYKVKSLYQSPSLPVRRERPLGDFFKESGNASVWLALDQRYTWGRYVLDAAAMQIPIVTTRSTGQAEHFFPDTMLENEFEIEKARELILRLFGDKEFYKSVATVPLEKFDHLRPEVKKKELLAALYS